MGGALVGVFLFMQIQHCTGASGKSMIIFELLVYMVLCLAGGCGIITALPGSGFYVVMAPCMLMIGSIQSYSRSVFSSLVPKGKEAKLFTFYEVTDKGSNVIGAIVTTVVYTLTKSYTGVFWYLLVAFAGSA